MLLLASTVGLLIVTIALSVLPSNVDTITGNQPLNLSGPFISDVNGSTASKFRAGQQVVIAQTITNNLYSAKTPIMMLTEVRDSDGVTIYLAFQSAQVAFNETNSIGVSWSLPTDAKQGSTYFVRVWSVTGFETPEALTAVLQRELTVA